MTMKKLYYLHRNGDLVETYSHSFPDGVERGSKISKSYALNYAIYRKIAGSVVELFEQKKNEVIFPTYTIKNKIDHAQLNKLFGTHIRNLRKTYGLVNYIWVAEYQKRGVIHYHCLFDMPFIAVSDLSRLWDSVIAVDYFDALHSVSFSKKWPAIVRDKKTALNYMCKYFSKSIIRGSNKFTGRVYAMSHNLVKKPVKIQEYDALAILDTYQGFRKEFDWATVNYLASGEEVYGYYA